VQGIVSAAIRAAQTGSSLTLFGGGLQVRDFFDADDLAAAIAAAGVDSREAGVWNVGSGVGTCVIDVIRLVEEATGRPIEISMLPGREIDVPYAVLDCGRAEADLGWMATFELRESIARIVAAR
jgi:nucleoside-diphosphate-sugar epimerase